MIWTTIIFFFFICVIHCEEIKVSLKLGTIHGYKQKISNNELNTFLGIPFAKPPIGELRFRKPQPIVEKWSKPLDATKWPKICMQDTLIFKYYSEISEDCLYLNVWTPVNLEEDFSQHLRPVMVFIHGGGFAYMGSSFKHYNGSLLSSFGDVVVVTMNYRLGAFGFLTSGNAEAPGNVGLYDQALALEWVQENIAYFGGDPKKVTLFGESAGGWSVSLHLLSPVSQDTFSQAIIMSGAVSRGVVGNKENAILVTLELLKLLGCPVEEGEIRVTDEHIDCLRKVDAKKIVGLQSSPQLLLLSHVKPMAPFLPISGETFIPKKPIEMLEEASFNKGVDLLIGSVANEGFVLHLGMKIFGYLPKGNNWQEKLRFLVEQFYKGVSSEETEEILTFYFNDIDDKNSNEAKMAYYDALGDMYFSCEIVSLSDFFSKSNDVYQYLFDYRMKNAEDNLGPCDLHKPCHGNEIPLTFGTVTHPNDIEVSKKWMKILTDFAISGNIEWPKQGESKPFYQFTGDESIGRLEHNFRRDACKLWEPIFEKYASFH